MQESKSTANEVAGMLLESSLFRDFRTVDLRSVARYFRSVTVDKGEVIFREGDLGTFMCVVNAGNISVTKLDSDGHFVEVTMLRRGRVFGEMAVLDGEYRSATCVAAQDCVLLILSRDSLDKMELDAPKTAARVIRTIAVSLSRRLRLADGKLVDQQI
jgi:CRP/FNR family transcriptional regulator, cyclic AMP receptor protein